MLYAINLSVFNKKKTNKQIFYDWFNTTICLKVMYNIAQSSLGNEDFVFVSRECVCLNISLSNDINFIS